MLIFVLSLIRTLHFIDSAQDLVELFKNICSCQKAPPDSMIVFPFRLPLHEMVVTSSHCNVIGLLKLVGHIFVFWLVICQGNKSIS